MRGYDIISNKYSRLKYCIDYDYILITSTIPTIVGVFLSFSQIKIISYDYQYLHRIACICIGLSISDTSQF